MGPDDEPDDERRHDPPLPPEDRLWRHPTEMREAADPPASWFAPPTETTAVSGRTFALSAVAGACLVGVVVAVGVMWATRPTQVVERPIAVGTSSVPVATASYTANPLPAESLAEQFGPSLASVRVQHDGQWRAGTGVWLDANGSLLTAMPLVAGATQVLVSGRDGVDRPARVAGSDPGTGVTTLVVSRTSGIPLDAPRTPARSGQLVVIIGAPGAVTGSDGGAATTATTATTIVRVASMRASLGDLLLHDAVQLDRAVPDDAVGGLIVDDDGQLLGVTLGNTNGAGIATPATDAVDAARALRDHGKVPRAWLGVQATDVDPAAATMLDLPGAAQVTDVTPASPAAAGGVQVGDMILAIDRHGIDNASDLVVLLRSLKPGTKVSVTIERNGKRVERSVTLGG